MDLIRSDDKNDQKSIRRKLIEYNASLLDDEVKTAVENVSFVVKDDDGEIKGGITGVVFWHCLHIDILWVDSALRGKGYGSRLLDEIEGIARDKNCRLIKLDTFSFQAPEFYKKHGYEVFGVVEDHPAGYNQYFLQKRLAE